MHVLVCCTAPTEKDRMSTALMSQGSLIFTKRQVILTSCESRVGMLGLSAVCCANPPEYRSRRQYSCVSSRIKVAVLGWRS